LRAAPRSKSSWGARANRGFRTDEKRIRAENAVPEKSKSGLGWFLYMIGQVPALSEHFFDIDVTKYQRYPNTHGVPWNGLFGRGL
jgi:hypothetical protein